MYTLTYSYSNNAYTVTGYTGTPIDVVIPSTYNDGTNGEHPVTSIGGFAFMGCYNLTSVTIGSGVTSIGDGAFASCVKLKSVLLFPIIVPTLASSVFVYTHEDIRFYCFSKSLDAYKSATNWNTYADKIIADDARIYFTANANATKKFVLDNSSKVHTHHFDVVVGSDSRNIIPDGYSVHLNFNVISSDGTTWQTLSELDGKGYIISAFGLLHQGTQIVSQDQVFEAKLFYSALNNGTLLLNVHNISNGSITATAVAGLNSYSLQDSVNKI